MTTPNIFGVDLFGDRNEGPRGVGPVAQRFTFPPFSVLDARATDWQERKQAWLEMGISGEVGRDDDLLRNRMGFGTLERADGVQRKSNGTSVFDPVLCEILYRWFSPAGGQVVDPFAGGSVRGVVASSLGLEYWGCDLRADQIAANKAQADFMRCNPRPVWVCGDSLDTLAGAPDADLLFSCPPYGDLERYSDDPRDLSAMEWHTFSANYRRIIMRALARLKPDRFACFVVGDFRDPKGFYRNFVGETVTAFGLSGGAFYNDAVLLTSLGNAGMRATRQFDAGRKFVKTHQNVLVFCKGDPRKATLAVRGGGTGVDATDITKFRPVQPV